MKNLKLALAIILTFYMVTLSTAQRKVLVEGKYYINQRIYTFEQLDSVFSRNSISYIQYLEYERCLEDIKSTKNRGAVLSILGGLTLAGVLSWRPEGFLDALIAFPFQVGFGVLGTTMVTAGFLKFLYVPDLKTKAEKHLHKAVDFLNGESLQIDNKEEPSIGFGLTKSGGLGLTYNF